MGIAVLVTGQDFPSVTNLADFVYVLDSGTVVGKGEPEEVVADTRVQAAFLRGVQPAAAPDAVPPDAVRPEDGRPEDGRPEDGPSEDGPSEDGRSEDGPGPDDRFPPFGPEDLN
jgi:hypothetical protein